MSKTLVIVESPGKIETLTKYLGSGYKVMASFGHIRDLPTDEMGVVAPDFIPSYVITKPDVVKRLKEAAKDANEVILATDLDREGEAIAFHLQEALKLKSPKRITFGEITQSAVKNAVASPRSIDMNRVRSQEGRRALDRLVGYRTSSAISEIMGQKLSAGRVQSPALRLLVDREREIKNFKVTNHFGVEAGFDGWSAQWDTKPYLKEGEEYLLDRDIANQVSRNKNFVIKKIVPEEKNRNAPPPFTTSTMQQAAAASLKLKLDKTMEIAQQLYEGMQINGEKVGLITYMRTDCTNLSNDVITDINLYVKDTYGQEYTPPSPIVYKSKADAQEAHEAVRPTSISRTPDSVREYLTPDQARLYELIWQRTVACQMSPARFNVVTVSLESVIDVEGKKPLFSAVGRTQIFDGWLRLTAKDASSEEADEEIQPLPALSEGKNLTADSTKILEKKTKPPARFTETSLVKKLEADGIGRPATFASIIATLFARSYMAEEKGKLLPTELGCKVIDALVGRFAFAELAYTRDIEEELDKIAQGKASYKSLVTSVDNKLSAELSGLNGAGLVETFNCPDCGSRLRKMPGKKKGEFWWGCSSYPKCKETFPDVDGKPGEKKKYEESIYTCPNCTKPMRRLLAAKGPNKGKYFWSCSGYPDCKKSFDDEQGKPVFK